MSVIIKGMKKPDNCHECPLLYVTSICDGSKPCPIIPVKHGRWISDMAGNWCSVCGEISDCYFETNYCPNCGAPMDEAKEKEEEEKKNIFELLQEKGREVADVFLKKRF